MEFTETKDQAQETIAFPVKYDSKHQSIYDSKGMMVCDIKGWGKIQFMNEAEERQDAIGEKIAKLLNRNHTSHYQNNEKLKKQVFLPTLS